jgi:hypothetical protein
MADIKAKKVLFKNRDGEHLIPYIEDSGSLPVGFVFPHTCSADFVPENSLPCNGTEYTAIQFLNLYNDWLVSGKLKTCTYAEYSDMLATYGQCPMWGLDTNNNTFKVPTIKDGSVIQQAMTDSALGKAYNAGLPNITGTFQGTRSSALSGYKEPSGAFLRDETAGLDTYGSGNSDMYNMSFDASKSNSIYGNSNTVQSVAVALRYFVVVATQSIKKSAMDWSNWASSLNNKLNADHSNDTKPYVIQTYVNGTSGYRIWSDKYCEQWGQTTANSVTFLKPFENTNYSVTCTFFQANADLSKTGHLFPVSKTTTGMTRSYNSSTVIWEAKGYIA